MLKLLKNLLLFSFLFLSVENSFAQKKNSDVIFFRDTTVEYARFSVRVQKAFSKPSKLKVSMIISNPTENYMMFNTSDIQLKVTEKTPLRVEKNKIIAVAPKSSLTVAVTFPGIYHGNRRISVEFTSVSVTDKVLKDYDISLPMKVGEKFEGENFNVSIAETESKNNENRTILTARYKGNNFFGIQLPKTLLKTKTDSYEYYKKKSANTFFYPPGHAPSVENPGKDPGKTFYYPGQISEKLVLIFPTDHYVERKEEPKLDLKGVFTEYSTKNIGGFELNLREGTELTGTKDNEIEEMD